MIVEIRPSVKEDIPFIAALARQGDVDELYASNLLTPFEAMTRGMRDSEETYTGLIDGAPVCMWGVVLESFIGNVGIPWMIVTETADKHQLTFLRQCRDDTMKVLSKYGTLFNYVDARNTRAIRWLKWLGFAVQEPAPYGVFGLPFHRFYMNPQPTTDSVSIRKCELAEIKSNRNFKRLADEYAAEGKLFGMPPTDEKIAVYTMIEKSGFFHIFGAFEGNKLIGFIALLIPVIPHYGVGVAVAESFFVGKQFRKRGAGIRLLNAALRESERLKTPGTIISLPPESELFQALVKRPEYTEGNRVLYRKNAHA